MRLDDLGLVVSGFNLTGGLTAAGINGVAKGIDPKTMFGGCSSCAGIKNPADDPKLIEMRREN